VIAFGFAVSGRCQCQTGRPQANASAGPSSASRGTVTRRSPWTRDARATLHPAANGNSPCPHLLEGGVGPRAFLASQSDCLKDGADFACRHTGRATAGMLRTLCSGAQSENRCIRNPWLRERRSLLATSAGTLLAASSVFPGRGLCHGGRAARSTLDMDTTLRNVSVLCTSKYQTCTPSAPCRALRNACT
jgi:hypothetical protein